MTSKSSVTSPVVRSLTVEDRQKLFWCYFCQRDVSLHLCRETERGHCCVQHGGMLEHISGQVVTYHVLLSSWLEVKILFGCLHNGSKSCFIIFMIKRWKLYFNYFHGRAIKSKDGGGGETLNIFSSWKFKIRYMIKW